MKQKRTSKLVIVLLVILSVTVMYGLPIGLGIWMALSDSYHYEEKNGEIVIDKGDVVINNLNSYYVKEENETWKFKAKYYGTDAIEASGYKFSSINFY